MALGFIVTAWITILTAVCNAYYPTRDSIFHFRAWLERRGEPDQLETPVPLPKRRWPWLEPASRQFLNGLCDVQIVTGTAILLAGFAQGSSLSFYHEQLISSYWWLTLNSFWAARGMRFVKDVKTSAWNRIRLDIRTAAILITTVCSIVFQARITVREYYYWDPYENGRCYLYEDQSAWQSQWLWVAGLIFLAVSLVTTLFQRGRRGLKSIIGTCNASISALRKCLVKQCKSFMLTRAEVRKPLPASKRVVACLRLVEEGVWAAGFAGMLIAWWCLVQFVAVWSFGDGFHAVEVAVYIAYGAWTTWDITSLRSRNQTLLLTSENQWGFGQILPLILLATLGFSLVDSAKEALEEGKEKKDEEEHELPGP